MESANHMESANNEHLEAHRLGPYIRMSKEARRVSTSNLKAIYEIEKTYVEESAKTLSTVLSDGVDTFKHMQDIWFSSEEFVASVGRAIFTSTWGRYLDDIEVINKLTSLPPALYWRPTKELALLMFASANRVFKGEFLEYIHYAETHVLSQSLSIIHSSTSLSQAIQHLIPLYERFSARDYFHHLQRRAFEIYEERCRHGAMYDDEVGDWLRAERERLNALTIRTAIIPKPQPPQDESEHSAICRERPMFSRVLSHVTELQVDQSELQQPHTYDERNSIVSLARWIDQEAPQEVKLAFNRPPVPPPSPHIRSVAELDNEHLRNLTVEILTHADKTELVAIVGAGTYSYQQLIDEVSKGTTLGHNMVRSVRSHSLFMEEAIRTGKVQPKREQSPVIPDFEF